MSPRARIVAGLIVWMAVRVWAVPALALGWIVGTLVGFFSDVYQTGREPRVTPLVRWIDGQKQDRRRLEFAEIDDEEDEP